MKTAVMGWGKKVSMGCFLPNSSLDITENSFIHRELTISLEKESQLTRTSYKEEV